MGYAEFLAGKAIAAAADGFTVEMVNEKLFPFQRDIVRWALRRGRAAIFADCGLGKTAMQLEWAHHVSARTDWPVLILAPLAVSSQTVKEGEKFGIKVTLCRAQADARPGINITNYEMLHHFEAGRFSGIVLDESSILKHHDAKTRGAIIDAFGKTPYRLACTATPAPNDFMELGNHSEFLGIMRRMEMLSMFFVHDGGETQKWRLKGHAESEFWRWLASWAVMMRKPSDLGYEDDGFSLPPLRLHHSIVKATDTIDGMLFPLPASTLHERRSARRASLSDRVAAVADMANATNEQWLIWCDLNAEGDSATKAIDGAVQVAGADDTETKESRMIGFAAGEHRVLVSKPSIAGHGMNWQNCANVAFLGLSDSFESYYQAIRRCWRFGQSREVNCHIITSDIEGAVLANIQRKERDADTMAKEMVAHMSEINSASLHGAAQRDESEYRQNVATSNSWEVRLGDCVEQVKAMPEASVGYSVFSPPFASLYTYSNSDRDMGNVKDWAEFHEHFDFLIPELYRVLQPGRLLSFHCMNLPTSKQNHGFIGIHDFRGDLIRAFQRVGFIFHSEVVIWKDPVTAMQRTKALGLLYKQLRKDSCMSRQGVPDYLVTMRKPGENESPVTKTHESFPVGLWQNYASPVWMDIDAGNTLQRASAREAKDERHICPLQLEVIERAIRLWTNPGDLVLSPFAGIGSEGFMAVKLGRKFIGVELKESYWKQACANLRRAESEIEGGLFTAPGPSEEAEAIE